MSQTISIAVFAKERHLSVMRLQPKNKFIIIRDVNNIRGRRFDAIITIADWYTNNNIVEAYEALKERQPEIFE